MSVKTNALRLHQSAKTIKAHDGGGMRSYGMGVQLNLHSKAPPPVEEYDAWLATIFKQKNARRKIDGAKLRRAVIMRRNGCSATEIATVVGMATSALITWMKKLPEELKP